MGAIGRWLVKTARRLGEAKVPAVVRKDSVRWLAESVAAGCLLWFVFWLAGRILPKIAIGQLSELTNTKIETQYVDFNLDGSVLIRGLVVRPHKSKPYDNAILKADRVLARFHIGSLLFLRPRLKEISVNNFVFNIQHDLDSDEWNIAALRFSLPKRGGGAMPLVMLERGKIQYMKASGGWARVTATTPISARFRPAQQILGGYSFDATTTERQNFGRSNIVGTWQSGRIEVGGRISSQDIPWFERPWLVTALDGDLTYDKDKNYRLMLRVKDFIAPVSATQEIFVSDTRTVLDKFAGLGAFQKFLNRYRPAGRGDIGIQASGRLGQLAESKIVGRVHCNEVSAADRGFPYNIEKIAGEVDFTEKSATLNNLLGRHGDAEISINGWTTDFGEKRRYLFQITSNKMALDDDLYEALGAESKRLWRAFSPSGSIAINYSRSRQPQMESASALAVELLGVRGKYEGFPYPLENVSGLLFLDKDGITFSNVVSQADERKIIIDGRVEQPEVGQATYDLIVRGQNIALDETLKESLPPAQRDLYSTLEMSGLMDAEIKIFSDRDAGGLTRYSAEVFPKDACLKSKEFPLQICGISGKALVTSDLLQVEGLRAQYGDGEVTVTGRLWPGTEEKKAGYCLSVRAEGTGLTDDLIGILPRTAAEAIRELRPEGKINFTVDLSKDAPTGCEENRVVVECLGNGINWDILSYPLQDVRGRIVVTEKAIEFNDISAKAEHLIRGTVVPSTMHFGGQIMLGEQAGGISDGYIRLAAENLRIKGKSLSSVETVMQYDAATQDWQSRNLSGDLYGGKLTGKYELSRLTGPGAEIRLQAGFDGVDLKEFLADTDSNNISQEEHTTGRMSGSLNIVGRLADSSTRIGQCRLRVRNMQVGRLSPLAKLLAVLKLTEPTDFAFDQMLVDSYIKGNYLSFEKFDLAGKSVAFSGSGGLDLASRNIDLVLTARGRRLATAKPSIWQSLTEGLSKAVIRMDVKGDVRDPQVTTTTLPVIRATLGIFGKRPAKPD
jgi:hypothetical protein